MDEQTTLSKQDIDILFDAVTSEIYNWKIGHDGKLDMDDPNNQDHAANLIKRTLIDGKDAIVVRDRKEWFFERVMLVLGLAGHTLNGPVKQRKN
jgi:hypothetical protein